MYHKLAKDTPTAKSGDYVEVNDKTQKKYLIDNGIIEKDGIDELPKDEDDDEKSEPGPKVGTTADIIDPDKKEKKK